MWCCDINLWAILQRASKLLFCITSLKIIEWWNQCHIFLAAMSQTLAKEAPDILVIAHVKVYPSGCILDVWRFLFIFRWVNTNSKHSSKSCAPKRHVLWWHHQMIHTYDDIIKCKHFSRYWPFVRVMHWSPVNSPHDDQWHGALKFSLICAWRNRSASNAPVIWDAIVLIMTSL